MLSANFIHWSLIEGANAARIHSATDHQPDKLNIIITENGVQFLGKFDYI